MDDAFPRHRTETASFTRAKKHIRFVLKLLNRDFSTGVRLQMSEELIVFLHAHFAGRICRDTGTEFLEVRTYSV